MIWVGVDIVELVFLVFMLLTVLVGGIGVWRNLFDKNVIAAMWLSYLGIAIFFFYRVLIVSKADDIFLRNLELVIEHWIGVWSG